MFRQISSRIRLPRNSRDLLHAANLRHGTDGFTSPSKEGMLRIFSPLKIRRLRPGLNPANLGTKDQHATSKPPKPIVSHICLDIYIYIYIYMYIILTWVQLLVLFCEMFINGHTWITLILSSFSQAYGTLSYLHVFRLMLRLSSSFKVFGTLYFLLTEMAVWPQTSPFFSTPFSSQRN